MILQHFIKLKSCSCDLLLLLLFNNTVFDYVKKGTMPNRRVTSPVGVIYEKPQSHSSKNKNCDYGLHEHTW